MYTELFQQLGLVKNEARIYEALLKEGESSVGEIAVKSKVHRRNVYDTLNRLRRTVIVIPLSSAAKPHPPITVPVTCQGQSAVAVVDQIRAVARHRLRSKIETLSPEELDEICQAVSTVLELR